MKTIKFSPKKLDALADSYFKKAEGGREDFSSQEWIEIQELSGLALRRWVAQLREEARAQRPRDKAYRELVQIARCFDSGLALTSAPASIVEVTRAFASDPEPLDGPSDEDSDLLVLYSLFYAAAKRAGDL